jgi:hypothetical protein
MGHREPPAHPNEFDINLDWTRPDLVHLIRVLNPLLQEIFEVLRECPPRDDDPCINKGGYHNITFCDHS